MQRVSRGKGVGWETEVVSEECLGETAYDGIIRLRHVDGRRLLALAWNTLVGSQPSPSCRLPFGHCPAWEMWRGRMMARKSRGAPCCNPDWGNRNMGKGQLGGQASDGAKARGSGRLALSHCCPAYDTLPPSKPSLPSGFSKGKGHYEQTAQFCRQSAPSSPSSSSA